MNRTDALSYLDITYHALADAAGDSEEQSLQYRRRVIDQALRHVGFSTRAIPSAVVEEEDTLTFLALLDYYALMRFSRVFSAQMDVSVPGALTAPRSQLFQQVMKLLDKAENMLAVYGIAVSGGAASEFTLGRLNLDFLEPAISETGGGGEL